MDDPKIDIQARKCSNCGKPLEEDNPTRLCDEDCFYDSIYKQIDLSNWKKK